ncbi:MAG: sporulation membrane protein YtaF [Sarcina ventriculi]|uniref:Sporulation protein YtaF n=1 Tax=Sarcina ventriculi TaxID=1267 RepID=A0ABP2AUW5_SARVE|nr:sporulation membrane protein YtaF [Sarcina ventriculi]MDO4402763.1 sporulation membrane protein YtaF [Clostridiaceae bacterium]MBU5321420.1 sporulation membrane protein YtaF [Sarcina ventriculi]MCI5636501.1 sporulation membrane protein YtaF [Sarcina ventriculi]MDD7373441.1 sporulation membrane protein YtaF [Sarcina ventriculi]MDY7062855.1 sporulation membrane protein YtaF [Sarcina ventriculi]
MNLLATILFVLSASFDVFVVAMSYGFKNIKIKPFINFVISFISSLGTFISMEIGLALTNIIPLSVVNILGSIIMLLLGLYCLLDYRKVLKKSTNHKDRNLNPSSPIVILEKPEIADTNKSGTIEFKESILLSIALALNNVGLGIGASIAGLHIILTTIVTLIITIILIPLGFLCSKKLLNTWIGKSGSLISGILLIILAVITCLF